MRLGMQIAFGCVHRKTASTGLEYLVYNSFLTLTPMGTPQNRTIGVNLVVFHIVLATVDINMPPLQGLGFCSKTLL